MLVGCDLLSRGHNARCSLTMATQSSDCCGQLLCPRGFARVVEAGQVGGLCRRGLGSVR